MRAIEFITEQLINEVPLPQDWDPKQYSPGTTFKQRLAYALERAKKIGAGSSRVAVTIEYLGRPTVLKIAKNTKGLAQNSAEASILDDGYASQLGILIPLIDYDERNPEPLWIHTEMATRASDKKLSQLMGVENLSQLVRLADVISGNDPLRPHLKYDDVVDSMKQRGRSEEDIEKATEYASTLADLSTSFNVQLADLGRAANWGIYQGKPVIVDVGFTFDVRNKYYR